MAPPTVKGVQGGTVDAWVTQQGRQASKEVVYEPASALVGLYTDKRRNIAITSATPSPTPTEALALCKYDAVLTPTALDSDRLRNLKVDACHYPPEQLRVEATRLPMFLEGAS
jgi:hypothetical protein